MGAATVRDSVGRGVGLCLIINTVVNTAIMLLPASRIGFVPRADPLFWRVMLQDTLGVVLLGGAPVSLLQLLYLYPWYAAMRARRPKTASGVKLGMIITFVLNSTWWLMFWIVFWSPSCPHLLI